MRAGHVHSEIWNMHGEMSDQQHIKPRCIFLCVRMHTQIWHYRIGTAVATRWAAHSHDPPTGITRWAHFFRFHLNSNCKCVYMHFIGWRSRAHSSIFRGCDCLFATYGCNNEYVHFMVAWWSTDNIPENIRHTAKRVREPQGRHYFVVHWVGREFSAICECDGET